MFSKFGIKSVVGAAALAIAGWAGTASATVIDLFTDPVGSNQLVTHSTATSSFSESALGADIIGGYRDIVLTTHSNAFGNADSARAGFGSFSFSAGSGNNATGRIQWDGQDNSAALNHTGLNHANLINQTGCGPDGCALFTTTVLSSDLGFEYLIGVYTDATNFTILRSTSINVPLGSPLVAEYQFALFALPTGNYDLGGGFVIDIIQGGAGANFTDVGALEFVVNCRLESGCGGGVLDADLTIGAVEKAPIPEPGMVALLGVGLLGAVAARRRRR